MKDKLVSKVNMSENKIFHIAEAYIHPPHVYIRYCIGAFVHNLALKSLGPRSNLKKVSISFLPQKL